MKVVKISQPMYDDGTFVFIVQTEDRVYAITKPAYQWAITEGQFDIEGLNAHIAYEVEMIEGKANYLTDQAINLG